MYKFIEYLTTNAVTLLIAVVYIISWYKLYYNAFKNAWAAFVPFYSAWTRYEIVYDKGSYMFLVLIPIYGIYFSILTSLRFCRCFGRDKGFQWVMFFFPYIAYAIMAFSNDDYVGPMDRHGHFLYQDNQAKRNHNNFGEGIN